MNSKASQLSLTIKEELKHVPTGNQSEAADRISKFLFATESFSGFLLKGYAGTGKSSLIGALVKALRQERIKSVLLAPTGRAAKVLGAYCDQSALTIHRKIYFSDDDNENFHFNLGANLHKNTLFIIDEASMIGSGSNLKDLLDQKNLLEDVLTYIYSGENCKCIFVGDIAQLPPVGHHLSPALDATYLNTQYQIFFEEFELTEVVRQAAKSSILENATAIRKNLLNGDYQLKLTASECDVSFIDGNQFQEELETTVCSHGIADNIVICRSNKRANLFNKEIRNRILWREEELSAGDLLMVVKNNYFWTDKTSENPFIANGDIVKITRIIKFENLYGFRFADIEIEFADRPHQEKLCCKIIIDAIYCEGPTLERNALKQLFSAIEEDFMDVKSLKHRQRLILKTPHFNALQVKFAYAITCHKAQGGQWPIAYIDQGYLTEEMVDVSFMRWMYTAVTRATSKLYLVNFSDIFKEF